MNLKNYLKKINPFSKKVKKDEFSLKLTSTMCEANEHEVLKKIYNVCGGDKNFKNFNHFCVDRVHFENGYVSSLNLYDVEIEDLTLVKELENLKKLYLMATDVEDISPEELKNLEVVDTLDNNLKEERYKVIDE